MNFIDAVRAMRDGKYVQNQNLRNQDKENSWEVFGWDGSFFYRSLGRRADGEMCSVTCDAFFSDEEYLAEDWMIAEIPAAE